MRRHTSSSTARHLPLPNLVLGPRAITRTAHLPAEAVLKLKGGRIRQPTIAIPLQHHPLAPRHHGHFFHIEDDELAVLAHGRDVVMFGWNLADDLQLGESALSWILFAFVLTPIVMSKIEWQPGLDWGSFGFGLSVSINIASILAHVGLLCCTIAIGTFFILTNFPLTINFSAWYAGSGVMAILGVAALAIWGFYRSQGGKVFGESLGATRGASIG